MSLIITCNSGSSNTKLALFKSGTLERAASIQTHSKEETLEWISSHCHPALVAGSGAKTANDNYISAPPGKCGVVVFGHRVVHGGDRFVHPTLIDEQVFGELNELTPLAPLHQPAALNLIAELKKQYPDTPQIACFDTAFHHNMPELERRLPLPEKYYKEGIKRYGFHGLSYQYIASVLPEHLGEKAHGRIIVAHLGNGSSMCALKNLKSTASTMGFSTVDGLMMGTRCGTLDAGVILHLLEHKNMSSAEISKLLYKNSGLLGVSGISSDMKSLLSNPSNEARRAVDMYCRQAAKQLCSLLPAIGGIDALVFTGGIGQHSEPIRQKILSHLEFLGDFTVLTIATDEESVIARACREVLL